MLPSYYLYSSETTNFHKEQTIHSQLMSSAYSGFNCGQIRESKILVITFLKDSL